MLTGADAASLARLGSSTGMSGRLRRGLQFMTMDQLPDLHVYELRGTMPDLPQHMRR